MTKTILDTVILMSFICLFIWLYIERKPKKNKNEATKIARKTLEAHIDTLKIIDQKIGEMAALGQMEAQFDFIIPEIVTEYLKSVGFEIRFSFEGNGVSFVSWKNQLKWE